MSGIIIPPSVRLADFIRENVEPILSGWESFARSIWPGLEVTSNALRDHAEDMLLAVARDMDSHQTDSQQSEKSKGKGDGGKSSDRVDTASDLHAISRVSSGFDLRELVAEYRALRASVIHLWIESVPKQGPNQLQDLIRFNEAIDQLLTKSVLTYSQQVDQSREVFLGILCHDLRNPLQAVTMISNLLTEAKDLERSRSMAAHLASSVHAMAQMISDLGDFTGIRLGSKMALSPGSIDLAPICREVLDEMEAIHPSRKFIFERDGELTGNWDTGRLRQMVTNLLRNAVQHGARDTPILLSATAKQEEVEIRVTNQGTPIPADWLQNIFEPMRRYHSVSAARDPGSIGLGLYIAREVATAHGGTIDVESGATGTTFTVSLPLN